jgi:hypothetical protein
MLRVSAVKELPALSRMRDVGLLDCEGASDDARVADGPGSGCSPVVEVKRVVITGDPIQIKVPGVCLGGCIMHVKSRRVYERRLRPQTGCLVQRLSCYSGECRHGDSAAPRRRTLHRQVSCRLRSPTGVHVRNPDGPAGEAARANQGLGRVRLKMMIASTRQAAATVTCQWAGAPARGLQVRVICSIIAWPRWALPAVAVSQQSPRPASDTPGAPSLTPHRRAQSENY